MDYYRIYYGAGDAVYRHPLIWSDDFHPCVTDEEWHRMKTGEELAFEDGWLYGIMKDESYVREAKNGCYKS